MMSKWEKIVAISAAAMVFGTTAYAESVSNWDLPSKTAVESVKIENKILMTTSKLQWNADQLKLFQDHDVNRQFFPALLYKVNQFDDLRSKLMFTNAPGAKFTRKLATDADGEEIKLSILNINELNKDKTYEFYTAWLHTVEGDSQVSFRSLQRYAQPNGTLNDLVKTDDEIATIKFKDAEETDKKYRDYYLPNSFDNPFQQYTWQDEANTAKEKSYALINSKDKLESYKLGAARNLKFATGGNKVKFAITFKNNAMIRPDELVKTYNLTLSQIYAAGIKENEEEYTVSWYDTGLEVMTLMRPKQTEFVKFYFTELEGTAYVEDLQKMSKEPYVDVIEIESNGKQVPTGVHWLNKLYGN
ncbi:hypothetical protein [Paenibacillus ferrarius]|nr:hypothetical protein [Paenibacillus ferrarius]